MRKGIAISTKGVGSILSRKLKRLGIEQTKECDCQTTEDTMNAYGPDLVRIHIKAFLALMKTEAKRRGLLWSETFAKYLILSACREAESKRP